VRVVEREGMGIRRGRGICLRAGAAGEEVEEEAEEDAVHNTILLPEGHLAEMTLQRSLGKCCFRLGRGMRTERNSRACTTLLDPLEWETPGRKR
jgi:hypothetical protein